MTSAGLLLMKSAGDESDIPIYRNRKWLAGFFLLGIVATIVEVSVLAVLPLSLVAPFAGLTIVFSLILASTGLLYTPGEQKKLLHPSDPPVAVR